VSGPSSGPPRSAGGTIEEGVFRTVLGHFASGVVVITGLDGGGPVGLTCQSFFSVSIAPPLVAVAPSTRSTSWPRVQEGGRFAVNVLIEQQEHLARAFSIAGSDKFAGVGWSGGPDGIPHLHDCLAWVDCTVEEVHPAGDHLLVVALVTGLTTGQGEPLIFYRGGYGGFRP
jgi:3-hydroxy-9,10-secoandrosta-1,3,5(10)-triene-9,17-dione monooxygenase reductase component